MKQLKVICALVVVVIGGFGLPASGEDLSISYPGQAENAADLRAEVEATCERWKAAMSTGDLKKVASFYADNGVILSAKGFRIEGREAIDEYWGGLPEVTSWNLITYFVDGVESLIVQRGRSELTMVTSQGEKTSIVEFTHFWQRQDDGSLKIVVDGYWKGL